MRHFRWQATVDSVLAALQVADPNRLRIEVEDTMRRFEQIVSKSEPSLFQPEETRDYRIREFRAELRNGLLKLLRDDPSNEACREALTLLENPRLRASLHRQPLS
jgi:hypothetical protein